MNTLDRLAWVPNPLAIKIAELEVGQSIRLEIFS